ncbi:MAG: hypothetical protein IAE79_07710 [Anaerolinea sp.]|nr:hypothetical protein [Anaerolinea sp.]
MNEFFVHTVTDTVTGARRYVIAPADVTLGLGITETVVAREPLAARFDAPVAIVARRQPMSPGLRAKLEEWRAELGEEPPAMMGDELAAAFFSSM